MNQHDEVRLKRAKEWINQQEYEGKNLEENLVDTLVKYEHYLMECEAKRMSEK
jgi:hypothetical protein